VECRLKDTETADIYGTLDDAETRTAIIAERALLAALQGGCQVPLGRGRVSNAASWCSKHVSVPWMSAVCETALHTAPAGPGDSARGTHGATADSKQVRNPSDSGRQRLNHSQSLLWPGKRIVIRRPQPREKRSVLPR